MSISGYPLISPASCCFITFEADLVQQIDDVSDPDPAGHEEIS